MIYQINHGNLKLKQGGLIVPLGSPFIHPTLDKDILDPFLPSILMKIDLNHFELQHSSTNFVFQRGGHLETIA